jgi:hypothetical protein
MYYVETQRPHLFPILIGGIALAVAGLFPITPLDVANQLTAGRDLAMNGPSPLVTFFSFNWDGPGQWCDRSWLSSIWLWKLYQLGGLHLLVIYKMLLLGLTGIFLIWRASAVPGADWLCSAVIVWVIPACRMQLTMRPHLFGYLATAFLLLGLYRLTVIKPGRERAFWFAALFAMQVVWINVHSSALLALIIVGIYLIVYLWYPDERKCLFGLLLVLGIASCLTPWGPSLLADAFHYLKGFPLTRIPREFACLTPNELLWYILSTGIALLALALGARANFRAGLTGWASLGIAILLFSMAFRSLRFIPYALLIAAPFVAEGISRTFFRLTPRIKKAAMGIVLGPALVIVPMTAMELPPKRSVDWNSVNTVLYRAMSQKLPSFSKTFLSGSVKEHGPTDISTDDRESSENHKPPVTEEESWIEPSQRPQGSEDIDFCRQLFGTRP